MNERQKKVIYSIIGFEALVGLYWLYTFVDKKVKTCRKAESAPLASK